MGEPRFRLRAGWLSQSSSPADNSWIYFCLPASTAIILGQAAISCHWDHWYTMHGSPALTCVSSQAISYSKDTEVKDWDLISNVHYWIASAWHHSCHIVGAQNCCEWINEWLDFHFGKLSWLMWFAYPSIHPFPISLFVTCPLPIHPSIHPSFITLTHPSLYSSYQFYQSSKKAMHI